MRRWLVALHEQVNDLHGAARDRARKKRRRVLSRYEAKRVIEEAGRALAELLEAAEAGLTPAPRPPEVSACASEPQEEAPSSQRRVLDPPPGGEGA